MCLVRNSDKGAQVASQYAKIRLVYGDLDSVELLEEEARKADVVMSKLTGLWTSRTSSHRDPKSEVD